MILSGERSSQMGGDKGLAMLNEVSSHSRCREVKPVVDEVIIVVGSEAHCVFTSIEGTRGMGTDVF
ncbi:MAG: hypothetical protein ABSA11_11405 [Candidatus Bathyarchaeia archaeon]